LPSTYITIKKEVGNEFDLYHKIKIPEKGISIDKKDAKKNSILMGKENKESESNRR